MFKVSSIITRHDCFSGKKLNGIMVATKIENTNLKTIESVLGIVARLVKMLSCIVSPKIFKPIIPTVMVIPAQTTD